MVAAAPGAGRCLRRRLGLAGLAVLQLAPVLCLLAALDAGGSPVPDRAHSLHPHNRAGRSSPDDSPGGTASDAPGDGVTTTTVLTRITVPSLEDTVDTLKNENWTRIALAVEDPANRSYVVSMGMLLCLGLTMYGHQLIKLWLFLGGFVSVSIGFWVFAPSVFDTDICCGDGTERAHALISAALGVVAGIIALWILNFGIFLCGTCFGLGIAVASRTVLAQLQVFQSQESFALFYAGCALVGGIVALYKERPIIICVTSFGGAFGFFVGVGYFEKCHFWQFALFAEHSVAGDGHSADPGSEHEPEELPECVIILASLYSCLSIIGMLVQCRVSCLSPKPAGGRDPNGDDLGSPAYDRHRQVDDIELKEMLLNKYIRNEAKRMRKKTRKRHHNHPINEHLIESLSDGDADVERQLISPRSNQNLNSRRASRKKPGYRRKRRTVASHAAGYSSSSGAG